MNSVYDLTNIKQDYKKINIKSVSIHHNTYRSKIINEEKDGSRDKVNLVLYDKKIEDLIDCKFSDNHMECKILLNPTEEANIILFEKKILKNMANKLIKNKCIDEFIEALDLFEPQIYYMNESPYFICKLDRHKMDVEEIVQDISLKNSSFSLDINIIPQEVRFKQNKILYIDYSYVLHKKEKDENDDEDDQEDEQEDEQEENNIDDFNDKKEDRNEENDMKMINENANENTKDDLNEKDIPECLEKENKNDKNRTLEEYDHTYIVELTKKKLNQIEKKKKEIKNSFSRYIQFMGQKITFDAKFDQDETITESSKNSERKRVYDIRFNDERDNLLNLLKE